MMALRRGSRCVSEFPLSFSYSVRWCTYSDIWLDCGAAEEKGPTCGDVRTGGASGGEGE